MVSEYGGYITLETILKEEFENAQYRLQCNGTVIGAIKHLNQIMTFNSKEKSNCGHRELWQPLHLLFIQLL